ncbi:hypothetical protein MATL_G00247080 [Megalops atlanticus]|uniref:Uncharacterized protein n=1 Tax=Megalops atlanticus TaxID=7932 RepID=A0A9D3PE53_MEGAT|nr:hypothetical protein MATL_G00247080 [Megalops atlanticus]
MVGVGPWKTTFIFLSLSLLSNVEGNGLTDDNVRNIILEMYDRFQPQSLKKLIRNKKHPTMAKGDQYSIALQLTRDE